MLSLKKPLPLVCLFVQPHKALHSYCLFIADYDPEDLQVRGADEAMDLDDGAVREHYFEVGYALNCVLSPKILLSPRPSALRNRLPSVADAKYEGVRVSRKQLLEDSVEGSDEHEHEEQAEGGLEKYASNDEDDVDSDDQGEGGSVQGSHDHVFERRLPSASEESDGGSESEGENPPTLEPSEQVPAAQVPSDDVTSTLQKTRENDIKKGQAVKRQIVRLLLFLSQPPLTSNNIGFMGHSARYPDTASKVGSLC